MIGCIAALSPFKMQKNPSVPEQETDYCQVYFQEANLCL